MATPLDALLRIKAQVTGSAAVQAMGSAIGGVQKQATGAMGALKRMNGALGGLGGALAGLTPLLSAAGLVAMGKSAINAADDMNDMAQRTGVSVEMLSKFQQAAKMSGTSIERVQGGLLKLAKAMQGAAASGQGAGKDIAAAMKATLKATEEGETRQSRIVEENTDRRIRAIDRESGRKITEIEKRYRKEQQRLQDIWDGTSQADINERGRREGWEDYLDAKRQAEIDKVKADAESKKKIAEDLKRKELDTIKEVAQVKKDALKQGSKENPLSDELDDLGLSGKKASEAFLSLGISLNGANGQMKSTDEVMLEIADKFSTMPDGIKKSTLAMQLFGKGGAELIPMLNGGRDSIESLAATMSTGFARAAAQLNDKMDTLQAKFLVMGVQIGTALLPVLQKITNEVMWMVQGFMNLDPQTQKIIGTVAGLTLAFVALAPQLAGIVQLFVLLGGLSLAPFLAAVVAVGVAFTLAYQKFEFFRNGVNTGLAGIIQGWQGFFTILSGLISGNGAMIEKGWGMMWEGIKKATSAGMALVGEIVQRMLAWIVIQIFQMPGRILNGALAVGRAIGNGIAGAVRSILTGMFNWISDRINGAVDAINFLIRSFNSIPNVPDIGLITRVPRFAQGGYVTGPTVGLVGEAGREYIVPEGKAAGFANNIMAGRRGAAAIPSGGSSGSSGTATINITTGPVMQDSSGQRWMTIEDGERMVRQAAAQLQRTSRTPGGRYSQGVR